jgi:hypothetical protein
VNQNMHAVLVCGAASNQQLHATVQICCRMRWSKPLSLVVTVALCQPVVPRAAFFAHYPAWGACVSMNHHCLQHSRIMREAAPLYEALNMKPTGAFTAPEDGIKVNSPCCCCELS